MMIREMLVRIANREDPDRTASSDFFNLGYHAFREYGSPFHSNYNSFQVYLNFCSNHLMNLYFFFATIHSLMNYTILIDSC